MSDQGFVVRASAGDTTDSVGRGDAGEVGKAKHQATADKSIVAVTLCGTLWVATLGILYLMATGTNVNLEATLAVAAGWYKLCERLK